MQKGNSKNKSHSKEQDFYSFVLSVVCLLLLNVQTVAQDTPYVMVLGIAQDGGYPHVGCNRGCCKLAWKKSSKQRYPVSLALVDPKENQWWLVEASPDIKMQLHLFQKKTKGRYPFLPKGILLTHAHIGHYTGLMQLGREALNAKKVSVYVLSKMANYLKSNGPWSQLIELNNISLITIASDSLVQLSNYWSFQAMTVPHRDEFSETAGFSLCSKSKRYLFIPDTDKWEKMHTTVQELVAQHDLAFLDATFLSAEELAYRNIREVPHPFVKETMQLIPATMANKVCFIHFNHTNPLLWNKQSKRSVIQKGFLVAQQGGIY
jgi:pyrroloquinoline quinone biosynthesis protein B